MLHAWSSIHPLVVHFPVALLLFAVPLACLSLAREGWLRLYVWPATIALIIGVASVWLAVATGDAAVHRTGNISDEVYSIVEQHEEIAETMAWIFTAIAAAYLIAIATPYFRAKAVSKPRRTALLILLAVFYVFGTVELVRAAHLGGLLVHRHGVRAKL